MAPLDRRIPVVNGHCGGDRIRSSRRREGSTVELLEAAWTEGRSVAFDDQENEDVHSDPEFARLVGFLPYKTLMRGDGSG